MPVRSIVSLPADGAVLAAGTRLIEVRGAAWAGDHEVANVDVTIDGGASLLRSHALEPPRNRYDWTRWVVELELPADGFYEIHSRATDSQGIAQPSAPPTGIPTATAATSCTA